MAKIVLSNQGAIALQALARASDTIFSTESTPSKEKNACRLMSPKPHQSAAERHQYGEYALQVLKRQVPRKHLGC